MNCQPTMRRVPRKNQEDSRRQFDWQFNMYLNNNGGTRGHIPVVDASGRIDLLDRNTLELVVGKGHLPVPKTLYGEGLAEPRRLLHYEVDPIHIGTERTPRGIDWEYAGMVVGSMSRQGTSMTLAVFDKDGKLLRSDDSKAVPYHQKVSGSRESLSVGSAQAVLSEVPRGPVLATFRYLAENLHPPILTTASFFFANHIEAGASHRTLFLMPNSFAAQHRDMIGHDIFTEFFRALLVVMLPAVLLVVFLAWRVVRDAKVVGLSSNTRLLWVLGTLGFGLPAYITYRLTRPKAALVTCANCGLPRRPDMDRCHRCDGPWRVPELNPPAWRVLDGGRPGTDELASTPEETPAE